MAVRPNTLERIGAGLCKMRLITKLYASFGILLAIAIVSASMMFWSAREATFHLDRTHYAHRQHEAYLALSNHTYQLFKQFGDAMLIGDRDRGAGETELVGKIRSDISTIRKLIGQEIELVGEEEIEELDRLATIERQIELLLNEYALLAEPHDPADIPTDWGRLSHLLDEIVDRDFNQLIQEALDDEAAEVSEIRERTAGRIALLEVFAAVFGAIAVLAAGLSLVLLVRDIRRPINKLLVGARALADGKLEHRIDAGGMSELEDVGRAFNSMADEIAAREATLSQSNVDLEKVVAERTTELQRVLDQLRANEANRIRLLADVSHELRTPLTIIRGEADIALRGGDKPPRVYREALEKSRDAASHTARLVDDLLFVARRESGDTRLRTEPADLATLVPEIIEDNRSLVGGVDDRVHFTTDLAEAIVRADRDRLRQAVVILLENALRYSESDVTIRLDSAPAGYAISVSDTGPGMTEEEQARAFDRFFRGSDAAERYKTGAGLGLPVAKAIVEAHGGRIALKSAPGHGVTVSFTVPARPRLEAVS